ncbi:TrmB family transcriptional regulator [Candidatus Woesearchaeota archaeon]|nr:TrmB family transcriptional regulator [Candidatus Woesearchaeota archaeon]
MELQSALKEFGLSENEIKVYLALIKTGESTAQNTAKTAGLPRTTTYHLLESLEQKGLVGFVIKESKKYFQAANPKKLIQALEEKKNIIQEIIPELSSISETVKEKPKVTVYEGLKGIRSILKDVLEEKRTIYHYGDIVSIQEVFSYAFPQYIKERVKRKIPIKIICKKEELHKELLKTAKKELREFVFVPENYEFKSSVFIYANKVAIFNIKREPYYVVVIENEDFYDTQKNLFEIVWKLAKQNR